MIFSKEVLYRMFDAMHDRFERITEDPDSHFYQSLEELKAYFIESEGESITFEDIELLLLECYTNACEISYLIGIEDGAQLQHSLKSGNFANDAIIEACMKIGDGR